MSCTPVGRLAGRSPRVRGSRREAWQSERGCGSIPACAGEPILMGARSNVIRVDPRVCGGAGGLFVVYRFGGGRSPRVRGSRGRSRQVSGRPGSIPACAGEPGRGTGAPLSPGVDPRVCGGAVEHPLQVTARPGRSPRVRGSLGSLRGEDGAGGSIPACAGEPPFSPWPASCDRVDPRVCGGATRAYCARRLMPGRSPRVRGSLYKGPTGFFVSRSIPACAGEPVYRVGHGGVSGVDPRVCGGARAKQQCLRPQ